MVARGKTSSLIKDENGLLRDPREEGFADLLYRLRGLLAEEMKRQGLSKAEVARRIGVSPSVVTRLLNPSADILASSLSDLAWAIDREWNVALVPLNQKTSNSNNYTIKAVFDGISDSTDLTKTVMSSGYSANFELQGVS